MTTKVHHRCVTTLDVGRPSPSSSGEKWASSKILFHGFAALPSAVDQYTLSPEFTCNGHKRRLRLFPGGDNLARQGYVSLYLQYCSGGYATATFKVGVLDKFQSVEFTKTPTDTSFDSEIRTKGWGDFCRKGHILDKSTNILDDQGTLAIVVAMQEDAAAPFVPNNPFNKMVQKKFLDEETADVCFEVGAEVDVDDGDEATSSPVTFHAHSFVLTTCSPMLAALFGYDDETATVSITDVKPSIFRHLLWHVYGGSVPDEELNTHAKDIIDVADKYSIANLKLEAEAAYVKSTKITIDNAMGILLYADAKNCAFLKEVVMDFLAENYDDAVSKMSFADFPVHVVKDVMIAFGRKMKGGTNDGSKDKYTIMRVSELRMKLSEVGLDVDGSREAMIDALKSIAVDSNEDAGEADRAC